MDYDETPTPQPNIFKKTWGSLFGAEHTNSSSTPNTELFQDQKTQQSTTTDESKDQFNGNRSANYDGITGLNTYRNTFVTNNNYDNDTDYEVTNSYNSRGRANSFGSSIRVPPMTPTSTSKNNVTRVVQLQVDMEEVMCSTMVLVTITIIRL
ncbi:unnamed protein product [Ambrosiozyma monospora]|uniref:Unnamed protein product n=1 Tax=Ambrosiozyma monospora TaxID=43982 RepID=A0A9W6Z1X6_AMBMO|nr:unnamed protein product [Ambrosiozyma monospora]